MFPVANQPPVAEPLEDRVLLSTAAAPPLAATYAGSASLRSALPHLHVARHVLNLDLTDDAGQLTGTAAVAGVGKFAVSGTLTGRTFVLSAGDAAGAGAPSRFTGHANARGTRLSGNVLGLAAGGQTFRGTFSLKAITTPSSGGSAAGTGTLPRPDHVVVVVEENHSYGEVLGGSSTNSDKDNYIRQLASTGASFTNASAETHPSQPNYLALFSGSTQGVTDDSLLPNPLPGPDVGGELLAAGLGFAGYSEDLPAVGFAGATSGDYARKHNPWSDFADLPASTNLPFSRFPRSAAGYAKLPTVSFVVPNQQHDMHSGSVQDADKWLRKNLSGYAGWARSHHGLLIVTWDEDDGSADNHIATIISGQPVRPGKYAEPVNHYRLLRTLEDVYRLPPTGLATQEQPITDAFK